MIRATGHRPTALAIFWNFGTAQNAVSLHGFDTIDRPRFPSRALFAIAIADRGWILVVLTSQMSENLSTLKD
jgi:hypothetical protein